MPLTVRLDSPSGGGSGVAEDLTTTELDVTKYLAPDGAGGVQWLNFVLPNVENLPTAELDTTRYLAPDGAGGLVWTAFPVVDHNDLSGVTPDQHHAQQHLLGGADHSGDILANVNTKVSDYDLASVTKARMDFYVRDDIGDDANPGTIALPLKTIAEAERRIPDVVAHPVVIHLGVHPVGGWVIPVFRSRVLRDHVCIIGDGAGTPGVDGFTDIVASTPALAGSNINKVVSVGLDAIPRGGYGEYSTYTIEILTGAAAGDRKTIRRNTTTDILPMVNFTAAVAPGDFYRIVMPSIHIVFPDSASANNKSLIFGTDKGEVQSTYAMHSRDQINPYSSVVFINLHVPTLFENYFSVNNVAVIFLGITVSKMFCALGYGTIRLGVEGFYFAGFAANEGVPLGNRIFLCPSSLSWAGWGLSIINDDTDGFFATFSAAITIEGFVVAPTLYLYGGLFYWEGGACWAGVINIQEHENNRGRVFLRAIFTTIEIGNVTSGAIFRVCNGILNFETASWGAGSGVYITSNGTGIRSFRNSEVYIRCRSANSLFITADTGLAVEQNSQIMVTENLPTIAAVATKDFTVNGGLAYHPIADLVVGAHFCDQLYGHIYRTGDL